MNWPWPLSLLASPSPGRRGEALAASHLKSQGYRILQRNLRAGRHEADLVALDPDGRSIAIVEVKTRLSRDDRSVQPEQRVDKVKQGHLIQIAWRLKRRRRYADAPIRFDVVAVTLSEDGKPLIRHHRGAFDSPR